MSARPERSWEFEDEPIIEARPRRHLWLVRPERTRLLPLATIARVGSVAKGDTGGVGASSVAATWGATTTAGNFLVAIVQTRAIGTNTPTFTAPAGWVAAPPSRAGASGGSNQDPSSQIFYIANCGVRSGSESFSWTGTAEAILYLAEYSGVATVSPYDTEGNFATSATQTNVQTGTTGNLATSNSLCVGSVAVKNQTRTLATPQNGYTLVRTDATSDATAANGIATGYLELVGGTAGATTTTGLTVNVASQHTGVLAVFKPAASGTLFSRTATDTALSMSGDAIVVKSGRAQPGDTALALTETLAAKATRIITDTALSTAGGALVVRATRALTDAALVFSEALARAATRKLTDMALTFTESLVERAGRALVDTALAVTESISRRATRTITDTAVDPGDALAISRNRAVTTTDTAVTFSDSISRRLVTARTLTDSALVISDVLVAVGFHTTAPGRLVLSDRASTRLDVTDTLAATLTVAHRPDTAVTVTSRASVGLELSDRRGDELALTDGSTL